MLQDIDPPLHPRDIANTAEAAVIALPQKILAALLNLSLTNAGGPSARGLKDRAYVDAAAAYLAEEFEAAFEAAAEAVAEPLHNARVALSDAVEATAEALDTLHSELDHDRLSVVARETEKVVAPAVSSFLGALFDQVVAFEKAQAKRAQEADSGSLDEIELIARKINFIAINASVEAARVGDVGKGFAVIASEIKELSQQAKNSVDRIRTELA